MSECYMVCDKCGHIDRGPEGPTYECAVCGSGAGWGYALSNKAKAEQKSLDVRGAVAS